MIKHLFMTIIIMVSSSSWIYGSGNVLGKRERVHQPQVEQQSDQDAGQLRKEIHTYLHTMTLPSSFTVFTKLKELEWGIEQLLKKNLRDEKIFPVFNTLLKAERVKQNKTLQDTFSDVIDSEIAEFVNTKAAELNLQ